jgi:hypothetical protein
MSTAAGKSTFMDTASSAAQGALRGYKSLTDKAPWAEAALLGSLGAVGGHFAAKKITDGLVKTLLIRVPPEQRAEALRKLEEDGTVQTISRIASTLGGVAGVAYPVFKHMDTSAGWGRAAQSLLDPKYKQKYKHVFQDKQDAYKRIRAQAIPAYEYSQTYTDERGGR